MNEQIGAMNDQTDWMKVFRDLGQFDIVQIIVIIAMAFFGILALERLIPWLAERMGGRFRLYLLPSVPILRLVLIIAAIVIIVPLLIKPSLQNFITILGVVGIGIGFAFKDYVSSIIAGVVTIYESPYRPGDWVKINDAYGEVRSLTLRTLRIVTPDDTVVTIPHSKIWDTNIYNDTDGGRDLQCITDFYLDPNHDAEQVRHALRDVALTSPYLQLANPIIVLVMEEPWYTHYQVKAYPIDARDQFEFMSDITVRGKTVLARLGVPPARLSAAPEETRDGVDQKPN